MNRLNKNTERKDGIRNKLKVLNQAQKILKVDADDLLDLSEIDLKTSVVKAIYPDSKTDGQSEDYISALYDIAIKEDSKSSTKKMDKMVGELEENLISNRGRKNMGINKQFDMKAKKGFEDRQNAWKKNQYETKGKNY